MAKARPRPFRGSYPIGATMLPISSVLGDISPALRKQLIRTYNSEVRPFKGFIKQIAKTDEETLFGQTSAGEQPLTKRIPEMRKMSQYLIGEFNPPAGSPVHKGSSSKQVTQGWSSYQQHNRANYKPYGKFRIAAKGIGETHWRMNSPLPIELNLRSLEGGMMLDEAKLNIQAALFLHNAGKRMKVEVSTLVPIAIMKVEELPLLTRTGVSYATAQDYVEKAKQRVRKSGWNPSDKRTANRNADKIFKDQVVFVYGAKSPQIRIDYSSAKDIFRAHRKVPNYDNAVVIMREFASKVAQTVAVAHKSGAVFSDKGASSLRAHNVTVDGEILDLDTFKAKSFGNRITQAMRKEDMKEIDYLIRELRGKLYYSPDIKDSKREFLDKVGLDFFYETYNKIMQSKRRVIP